ncbi:mucin-13-like isoform X4 [Betta splendens]|uniref:Mucin-13-like isoform X4 n=1 Tax=Betta splendens TaxID=158456 RepID=A0A8M1H816_BETSP|nr:mucin-13-like isoform X4 [Betta splendens]
MAKEFKLLCIVWLIVASLSVSAEGEVTEPPAEPTTTTLETTTTSEPTTTTLETTTTSEPPTTALETTTTSEPPTTALESTTTSEPTTTALETTTTSEPTTTTLETTTTSEPTTTALESTTTSEPTPTTTNPGPCALNPCGRGSTCDPRVDDTFVCLCLPGDVYNEGSRGCDNAKVFPGNLNVPEITYDPKVKDKTSQEFKDASSKIIDALSPLFQKQNGYLESIVVEIQRAPTTARASQGDGVRATVDIIFEASSEVKSAAVDKVIQEAFVCTDCVLAGGEFKMKNLCDSNTCDSETTNCTSTDGVFTCPCNDGYIKTDFSVRMCSACPSGQQANKDSDGCEACPFGYSGFNCNESWQLVLVIVGSVLGGLLLISLILLPVVAVKGSKKSYEDTETSYSNPLPIKLPLGQAQAANGLTFTNQGGLKIPRATTTSRTNLEMTPANSSWFNQHNQYAQSRPQMNPYARSQGYSNPHYNGRH